MTAIDTPIDLSPERTSPPDVATPAPDRAAAGSGSSLFARHGLSNLDVLVMFVVVLITCAYTPFFFTWFWAPRAIMLFVTLPAGLVATLLLARGRDRAARWGLAVVAWATLSAALSGGFFAAFRGFVGQDTTVLFWTAALGLYSLGRMMSDPGRAMLGRVVLAVLGIHAAVGSFQMLAQIEGGNLGLLYGRSIGLTPNPVFLGGLMAMGVAICLHRVAMGADRATAWGVGAALFATVLSFSGSRVALVSVIVVAGLLFVRHRSRPLGVSIAGVAVGVLAGSLITRLVGPGFDATSRLSQTDSGGRITVWLLSWDAFRERPLFGWGLGRFRTAIQGDLSFEYVASIENSQVQWDAHNLIVGTTVAIGLPGLILLCGFVWWAVRSASGAFAYAALAVSVTWLLQPAALMTLPFALVLLGAAARPAPSPTEPDDPSASASTTSAVPAALWGVAVVLGLVAGGWLAVAEVRLSNAVLDGDPYAVSAAASMYPRDPIVQNVVAVSFLALEPLHPEYGPPAQDALERSIEYESSRPRWWTELANRQGALGDLDAALASSRRALDLQPTDATAWELVRQIGLDTGDGALVGESEGALCRLGFADVC